MAAVITRAVVYGTNNVNLYFLPLIVRSAALHTMR